MKRGHPRRLMSHTGFSVSIGLVINFDSNKFRHLTSIKIDFVKIIISLKEFSKVIYL